MSKSTVPLSKREEENQRLSLIFRLLRLRWRVLFFALLLAPVPVVWGQAHLLESAAPGLLEVGEPPFFIRGQEEIGLNTPPTDFQVMPDGRILVYSPGQLALGDGTHWEVFQQADHEPELLSTAVVVDRDGTIYTGTPNGFGKVIFQENGRWRIEFSAGWKGAEAHGMPTLRSLIQDGDSWYWHGESGPVVLWHPGQEPRVVGRGDTIEHVFNLGLERFLSDRTSGRLYRLEERGMEPVAFLPEISVNETITCSVPYGPGRLLVGTYARGLWVFDGHHLEPFIRSGPLAAEVRINALCAIPGGQFAAAVENYGIVFFDAQGRTLQILDSTIDHRLSHVRKLTALRGGVLWGLLNEGILSIGYPSRVSNFEPMIGSGVAVAHSYRHNGRLWMLVDGKVRQGSYDPAGRLTGFAVDTPPDRYAFALSEVADHMIAGTNRGAYVRTPGGWEVLAADKINLRILDPTPIDGRWLYGAQNEVGWLKFTATGCEITPLQVSGLDNLYNSETDSDGSIWIEMGNGRLARLVRKGDQLSVEFFGRNSGIPEGWAQLFKLGGRVAFNFAQQVMRFDEQTHRFFPDEDFVRKLPMLTSVYGRPVCDPKGRLWVVSEGAMHVLEEKNGVWRDLHEKMPAGFEPYFLAFEKGGIVWMHREFRLARYDPETPVPPPEPLRALITRIEFPLTGRNWFVKGDGVPVIPFSDNSLGVHYVALGSAFAGPVTFEVKLEGSGDNWVAASSVGSTSFNRMKEGRYVLHVRPRTRDTVGEAAVVSFVIEPPWYRTRAAYVFYALGSLSLIGLVAWLSSFIQRRENSRLEHLVVQRTRELVDSNRKLGAQVEEIQRLSQAVEQSPTGIALTNPEGQIVFANPRFCAIYGYAWQELQGRNLRQLSAEPLTEEIEKEIDRVLSARQSWRGQMTNRTKDGRTIRVRAIVAAVRSPDGVVKHLLVLHDDITEWLAEQERRRRLESQLLQAQKLDALGTLAGGIAHDFNNILTGILGFSEIAREMAGENFELQDGLKEITKAGLRAKDLVARILTFTRQSNAQFQPVDLSLVVMEAVKLLRASTPATIEVMHDLESGTIQADPTQIQQIVINLGTNAVHAVGDRPGRVEVEVKGVEVDEVLAAELGDMAPGQWMRLTVSDNGKGMDSVTISRIFEPFFTTKKPGEGTGLGLAIVRAILNSHHGAVRVRSTPGQGTTFELYFPRTREIPVPTDETKAAPQGGGREILVVDDEVSVGKFVSVFLQKLGYRPEVFLDPREALAAFEKSPSRFGAIVTDLTMPHMSGAELLERVRARGRMIPAVIISGYSEDLMRLRSETVSHCAVLQKPFTGEDLGRALEQVLRG